MLDRIRAKGVTVAIVAGRLQATGTMTALQRRYLTDHEPELLAMLREEAESICVRCKGPSGEDCQYAVYVDGLLCGSCVALIESVCVAKDVRGSL